MTGGDDPRDPSTAAGMPPPWPVVDKHSTYEHPPQYAPGQPPASYGPPAAPPRRTGGSRRWVVVLIVAFVLALALTLWVLLA
jgi:hypothetical protein